MQYRPPVLHGVVYAQIPGTACDGHAEFTVRVADGMEIAVFSRLSAEVLRVVVPVGNDLIWQGLMHTAFGVIATSPPIP